VAGFEEYATMDMEIFNKDYESTWIPAHRPE